MMRKHGKFYLVLNGDISTANVLVTLFDSLKRLDRWIRKVSFALLWVKS